MALSFSRPDPSSPDSVSKAAFSTGRRGYEQNEVRDFLRMVAAELARLQERERFLDRELRTAQRNAPTAAVALDEEMVTKLLGEEAVRILSTAREAASQIKIRAEDGAARTLREASDEAQRVREEANVEAARRRQDAAADAESELEMAKQQGREMVNEARTYRERVLSELARRREAARQQIEQLVHGRDRLLQAFERARLAAVDVMSEMTPLGEPSEYVNLSPTTGPVPVMVPNLPPATAVPVSAAPVGGDLRTAEAPARDGTADDDTADGAPADAADDAASTDETERNDDTVVVALFAGELDVPVGAHGDRPDSDTDTGTDEIATAADDLATDPEVSDDDANEDDANDEAAQDTVTTVDTITHLGTATEPDAHDDEPAVDETNDDATIDELDDDDEIDDDDVDADAVDDLFARLRAARAESVAQRAGLDSGVATHPTPGQRSSAVSTSGAASGAPAEDATRALTRPEDLSVFATSPEAPHEDETIDDTPFGRRDVALTPLILAGARKLKRVLADEQNEVLHALRGSGKGKVSISALLPTSATHGERDLAAVADEIHAAAMAGARSLSDGANEALNARITSAQAIEPASAALVARVAVPLRERLERAVGDADGDRDELASLTRGVYREWKVQRIDEHLDDVMRIAFGAGALAAVEPGSPLQWIHDPRVSVCADCDDNALSGVIGAGDAFATGQSCAPAHEGCRCMLAIAPR